MHEFNGLNFYQLGLALFVGWLILFLSQRPLLWILQRVGFIQPIRDDAPARHHKTKQNIPTAGGLIFYNVLWLAPLFLFLFVPSCCIFERSFEKEIKILSLVLFCGAFSGLIGFLDDYLKKVKKINEGLRPKQKLSLQFFLAVIFSFALLKAGFSPTVWFFNHQFVLPVAVWIGFIFLVFCGTSNAVNLTDGLDGLASSVMAVCFFGLLLVGNLLAPQIMMPSSISLLLSILIGMCIGFLHINAHPARVFMGDVGSFFLGGLLASSAIVIKLELLLPFIAFVPCFEALSVIIQVMSSKLSRRFIGRDIRPFRMTPFHHHVELSGFGENKICVIFSLVQLFVLGLLVMILYGVGLW